MAPKTKKAIEDDETSGEDEEPEGDKGSETDDGDGAGGDDLTSHIQKVVREVVEGLLGDRVPAAKSSPAQDEQSIFNLVKNAQKELKTQEEKDAKLAGLGETVETLKKAVEKAPARDGLGGKLQRIMWGSE